METSVAFDKTAFLAAQHSENLRTAAAKGHSIVATENGERLHLDETRIVAVLAAKCERDAAVLFTHCPVQIAKVVGRINKFAAQQTVGAYYCSVVYMGAEFVAYFAK